MNQAHQIDGPDCLESQLIAWAGFGVVERDIGLDEPGVASHHLQIRVARQFLQRDHLAPIAQIIGGETVSETMRVDVLDAGMLADAWVTL